MPLHLFSPKTQAWFSECIGTPTQVQEKGWPAVASGKDVLLCAPTGTGKTLAAFLYWLDTLAKGVPLEEGVRVVYLSPLKALGNDIRENLQKPLHGLGLSGLVRAQVRTGDTPQAERARMAKHPPQILITTPESLFLLLTSQSGRRMLATTQCVICDELHALLSTKRGTHLSLSLERLDALCGRQVQRIGLSATVKPVEAAAQFLTGPSRHPAWIVTANDEKQLDIRVEMANQSRSRLHERSAWAAIAEKVYAISQKNRTTLAFCSGRSEAEKLAYHVNILSNSDTYARTHHGCVSREQRLEAEQQLRRGELRLLCCTSSMELGIDVGEIDMVVQVGAPASISSLLQRAGRAGHGPGKVSHVRIFPKTDADALSCALVARGALDGALEPAHIPQMCLDVLSQHIVSMAACDTLSQAELLALFQRTYAYQTLDEETLEGVLCMLAGDFEHAQELPVRGRILYDRLHRIVSGDNYTRLLACTGGGTIPDRGMYAVTLPDGTRLGELDEEYVFEARLGDKFLLGAFAWRIQSISRDRVVVQQASTEGAQSPFWHGDGPGRSMDTGLYYGRLLRQINEAASEGTLDVLLAQYPISQDAQKAIRDHVLRQREAIGLLADDRHIVIEHFSDEAGSHQLMLHSPLGRQVLRPLSMLLRLLAHRETGQDIQCYDDDEGVLLYLMGTTELPMGLLSRLQSGNCEQILRALLPGEPAFSIAFRYAAGRALMLGMRSGGRQPLWVQRLRGEEALGLAIQSPAHPLLWEATRECCKDLFDIPGLQALLTDIQKGRIRIIEQRLPLPSPWALPLRRKVEADMMYNYTPIPSAATRMAQDNAEQAAHVQPEPEAITQVFEKSQVYKVDSIERMHAKLLTEGDLLTAEAGEHVAWLQALEEAGRALYTGLGIWIAAEESDLYRDAMAGNMGALCRIARRCMRFRMPMQTAMLSQRYCLSPRTAQEVLEKLQEEGTVRAAGEYFVHRDVYAQAQKATTHMLRASVETQPVERLSAYWAHTCQSEGAPTQQLSHALSQLVGLYAPIAQWEGSILPGRVSGYRPQMLDRLLSSGEFVWQIRTENGEAELAFFREDDLTESTVAPPDDLSADARRILQVLTEQGAQFSQRIGARLQGAPVEEPLQALARAGLVRKDSFSPVRKMSTRQKHPQKRSPAVTPDTGRWDLCRVPVQSPDRQIAQLFTRLGLLSRETVPDRLWGVLLPTLRRMEYQGLVRRGYFVEGLSGVQFVHGERFAQITAFLAQPVQETIVLPANDPAQIWGRIVPHYPNRQFLCVGQTAVVLRNGCPCAVWERGGEALRIFSPGDDCIWAFAKAFKSGRIFPDKRQIVCKVFPADCTQMLMQAGFFREALDYVLTR